MSYIFHQRTLRLRQLLLQIIQPAKIGVEVGLGLIVVGLEGRTLFDQLHGFRFQRHHTLGFFVFSEPVFGAGQLDARTLQLLFQELPEFCHLTAAGPEGALVILVCKGVGPEGCFETGGRPAGQDEDIRILHLGDFHILAQHLHAVIEGEQSSLRSSTLHHLKLVAVGRILEIPDHFLSERPASENLHLVGHVRLLPEGHRCVEECCLNNVFLLDQDGGRRLVFRFHFVGQVGRRGHHRQERHEDNPAPSKEDAQVFRDLRG